LSGIDKDVVHAQTNKNQSRVFSGENSKNMQSHSLIAANIASRIGMHGHFGPNSNLDHFNLKYGSIGLGEELTGPEIIIRKESWSLGVEERPVQKLKKSKNGSKSAKLQIFSRGQLL
jgi:hypothetical protein